MDQDSWQGLEWRQTIVIATGRLALEELNASHTYHGGGDLEQGLTRSVGMLGVDWEAANGAYRIKKIIRGGPWDTSVRSPLDEPGVNVKEGEYVLAVNGRPIDVK